MTHFAAIDFETANQYPSSICSVGIVIVEGGKIIEKIYRLICPRPHFYTSWNTRIHGLTLADTNEAPDFPEVWNELAPRIASFPLVAHNSSFDKTCLKAAHAQYEMPYPDYPFYCTYHASRRKYPHLPNHRLHTVAAYCGFHLINHHHALADAEACAVIAMQVL